MKILSDYSGIVAIFVYSILFYLLSLINRNRKKKVQPETAAVKTVEQASEEYPLDLDDEDATVACLIASIECRNETKKNVQVKSVRRIA